MSLDIGLELCASYGSDAFDHVCPTVKFGMGKDKTKIKIFNTCD